MAQGHPVRFVAEQGPDAGILSIQSIWLHHTASFGLWICSTVCMLSLSGALMEMGSKVSPEKRPVLGMIIPFIKAVQKQDPLPWRQYNLSRE